MSRREPEVWRISAIAPRAYDARRGPEKKGAFIGVPSADASAGAPSRRGRLNAAIAQAVVRIHSDYVGRGPTKAHAFFRGSVVVVVMEDTMTKAERSLSADGRNDTVLEMKREVQGAMRQELVAAVEGLTGHKVRAFLSDNHIDPDVEVELFTLDQPIHEEPVEPLSANPD